MKALDYLYRMKQSNEEMGFEPINLYEAIEELEALQKRSCENYKYNKEQDDLMIFCDKEMCIDGSRMMWHSFKDFCCNKWESK